MRMNSHKQLWHGRQAKWLTGEVVATVENISPHWDLSALFDRSRPLELEIGSGKGTFLLARAASRPDVNFVGIERAKAYCHYAADRVRRARLDNVRMLDVDATDVVEHLQDASLLRVHVYFPDPWPKRKHHLRRTLSLAFLRELARILQVGGELLIVTDHLDYFLQLRRSLSYVAGLAPITFPTMADEGRELVGTNFERKYIAQGRAFYSTAMLKYI